MIAGVIAGFIGWLTVGACLWFKDARRWQGLNSLYKNVMKVFEA